MKFSQWMCSDIDPAKVHVVEYGKFIICVERERISSRYRWLAQTVRLMFVGRPTLEPEKAMDLMFFEYSDSPKAAVQMVVELIEFSFPDGLVKYRPLYNRGLSVS